jgi:ankyrin repeat protein
MTSIAAKVFFCLLAISTYGVARIVTAKDVAATAPTVQANENLEVKRQSLAKPLFIAIENDDANQVHLLLAQGADPNYGGADGRCGPLWHSFDASLPIVRTLLAAGANPNCVWAEKSGGGDQSLTTPLMAAAALKGLRSVGKGGRMAWTDRPARKDMPQPADVIKLLLEFGAKPNARSYFGTNALYDAIDADDVDAARALIDGGLDINSTLDASMPGEAQPWYRGQTALMHALGRYDLTNVHEGQRMIGMLLRRGANPNVPPYGRFISDCGQGTPPCSFSGETPLSYEARLGYTAYAELLLEHGAEPDAARADGAKPKDIAAKAGHFETAKVIGRYEK